MQTYYQKNLSEQLLRVEKLKGMLLSLSYQDSFIGHERELLEVVSMEEKLCLEMRQLLRTCEVFPLRNFVKRTREMLGITVEKTDNGVRIVLPPLRHREKISESTAYLVLPLFEALLDFSKEEHCDLYEKARITVCHCYSPDMPVSTLPDYDNFEMKNILDTIATYFLVDDNLTRCELLLTSRETDKPHTEITVIPLSPNA